MVNYAERFRLNVICFRWCTDWLLKCTSIFSVHSHTNTNTNTSPNNIIKMWTCISKSHRPLSSILKHCCIVKCVSCGDAVAFSNHYDLETFEFPTMIFGFCSKAEMTFQCTFCIWIVRFRSPASFSFESRCWLLVLSYLASALFSIHFDYFCKFLLECSCFDERQN